MGAGSRRSTRPPGCLHPCLCAQSLSRDDLAVSKGRGEQADGQESLRLDANYFCERAWVDGFRGERRVGASRRLSPGSNLHPGLPGPEWPAGPGSRLAVPVPLGGSHPDPRLLGVRGKARAAQLLTAASPRPGLWNCRHSFLNTLVAEDWGVRVSE